MKLTATVKYRGSLAHFEIRKEAGIYYADLVNYEGDKDHDLPGQITLVRGFRQWTGSFDDEILLQQLGEAIENSKENSAADHSPEKQ